jgi:hypothetical protein
MISVITAINNKKIYDEIRMNKTIKIIYKNIQYKEGIIEVLEKYEIKQKIDYIILSENLSGQINIIELKNKLKKINNKIKIIIILNKKNKKNKKKENYYNKNNIKYIYEFEFKNNKLLEKINEENKVIGITGYCGSGKTINMLLICKLLSQNKKVIIVEENSDLIDLLKKKNEKNEIIKIEKNLYLLNIKILNTKEKINYFNIINKINLIKNNYDYIFIEIKNIYSYNFYKKLINKNIFILNSNLLEIIKNKKIINYFIHKEKNIKIILNNHNENSISEKLLKNNFNNKIEIIEKLKTNKKYNLIINNYFNINLLDNNTKNKMKKIINNI